MKVKHQQSLSDTVKTIFESKIWHASSTKLDAIISLFYAIFWFLPSAWAFEKAFSTIFSGLSPATNLNLQLIDGATFNPTAANVMLTFWVMLAIDLATYVIHRAMHTWNWLWQIHSVHHATEHLNIFSTHRQHPVEPIMLNIFRGSFAAIGVVTFQTFVMTNAQIIIMGGMGAGFFIYMFTVNLHHLHIPVSYPRWLRLIFISPHVHHIHHSLAERHHNKNYGVVFSFWDRIGGSYYEEDLSLGQLKFGIHDDPYNHSLFRSLWLPLRLMFRSTAAKTIAGAAVLGTAFLASESALADQKKQIEIVTIVDEKCESTMVAHTATTSNVSRELVPLAKPAKPFVCTRKTGESFSCFSTLRQKTYQFKMTRQTAMGATLESNEGRFALIEVDLVHRRFNVVSTYRNSSDVLVTETCYGTAAIQ